MVGGKALSYQTHNQTTTIKETIHVIVTFSLHEILSWYISKSFYRIWVVEVSRSKFINRLSESNNI